MKLVSRFFNTFIIASLLIGLSPLSVPAQVHATDNEGEIPQLITDNEVEIPQLPADNEGEIPQLPVDNEGEIPQLPTDNEVEIPQLPADNEEGGAQDTVTPSLAEVIVNKLQHDQGYVLAVAGEPVDLASVSFMADFDDSTSGTIQGDQLLWSSDSSDISIADGEMTISKKGVYPVTVQKDDATVTMQVVAKDQADSGYVLYEENFDALANGSMPQGWTRKQGSTASKAAVKDGAFEIDALASPDNPSRVLLPDYLGLFGDYKIEADVTILTANNTARWDSIMFRIQNNDYPYYHMNVRKDATAANGIEFALRKPNATWEVIKTASFSEAIDSSKMYHYTVKAYGDRVQFSINDELLVDNNGGSAYTKGGIGLQADGNKMRVDNIRVTLQQEDPTGAIVNNLQHDQGYVLTVAGEPVDLASVSFKADYSDSTSGTIQGDQLLWKSASSDISIADGVMTVLKKGVYPVTVQKDGAAVTMQVVAKDPSDSRYVLYEENFDSLADGTMPQGWTRKEGSTASKAAVKGGAFEIDALASPDNPSRVLLPDYLGLFGDYKIEADVTIVKANDAARWDSIMFRIQNNNFPYYHMNVRKDATLSNGIEFAQRTPSNAWEVFETASFSEAIDSSKMYHYMVNTHGNRVQLSINNKVLIDSDGASAYTKGRIGLQANGNILRVDNIQITLQQDALPPMPAERFVQVKEPETKIALAPTVLTELESAGQLDSLSGPKLPATVILYVNNQLKVTDSSGQAEIGSLDSVLETINTRMIPAFYVKDEQTVDNLVEYLQNVRLEDADIISDNSDLVKRARKAYPIIRGIVDFTANTDWSVEKLLEIRGQTNVSQAKIILLPQNASSRDNVSYLQKLGMTVWTKEQAAPAEKNLAIHTLITAGTNGILTDSPLQAIDAMKLYSNQTTLIRKPYIVGHRGMPSQAPENTIEGNALAAKAGAELIETDVYLSKDGYPVILHDGTLERTTNGKGFIEDYTLEELKQLNANKPHPSGFPNVKIPTFEEQIDLARETGLVIQTEIKTSNPNVIEPIVKLIKEKKAEDLITVISFDSNQIKRMNEQMPELTTELIVGSGISRTWDVHRAVRQTLLTVQNLNAVYNANFTLLTQDYMEAAKHRGLTIAPWTFNNRNDLIQFFMYGTWGLTTDYAYWASDWTASIKPVQEKYTLSANRNINVFAEIYTYSGKGRTVSPEIVLLDGQDIVEVNGSMITAKQPGTAHALLRYTTTLDANNRYDLYTQPISFVVGSASDKTELTARITEARSIHDAAVEGALAGQYPAGSKATLQAAINKAQAVTDAASATQAQVGKAITDLNKALQAFVASINTTKPGDTNGGVPITIGERPTVEKPTVEAPIEEKPAEEEPAEEEPEMEFSDMKGHWAHEAILRTTSLGIVNGFPDGTFRPNLKVTRAEFAAMLVRAMHLNPQDGVALSFKDVGQIPKWAKSYIAAASSAGIINGYQDGTFRAGDTVTRAEMAVMLVRAAKLPRGNNTQVLNFTDADMIPNWASEAIAAAQAAGIVQGYKTGYFSPNSGTTRAEAAAVILRLLDYKGI